MKPNDMAAPLSAVLARPLSMVNLDEVETLPGAHLLPRSTPLHVDCAHLACQRTLGVGYVVSQLPRRYAAACTCWGSTLYSISATSAKWSYRPSPLGNKI
jgi:hypothetical protein